MREVLRDLTGRLGIRGALVLTPDGVVVCADDCRGFDEDAVAALASNALRRVLDGARSLELGTVRWVTLKASFGRLVFVPADDLVLAVVTEPEMDLDRTMLEIAGPARRLMRLARLDPTS